jgi:hypothetical protein
MGEAGALVFRLLRRTVRGGFVGELPAVGAMAALENEEWAYLKRDISDSGRLAAGDRNDSS